jgi:branched-chain amino acid transport system substrate-binding protein
MAGSEHNADYRANHSADAPLSASRRTVLSAAGATGRALMMRRWRRLQTSGTTKIGFVSPRTGPLGSFGEGDGYVLDLARKALSGGVSIGGKTYAVEILDRDTQSDPSRASRG